MTASRRVQLLIVGAGPFGLGLARYASLHGIDHAIVGRPMAFWREQMPPGMLLRSGVRWHLDPANELTFRRYMLDTDVARDELRPLGLAAYLDYVSWFERSAGIDPINALVTSLDHHGDRFVATMDNGVEITADRVVLAIGFGPFANLPDELVQLLPEGRWSHTLDFVDIDATEGKRIAIVGGRQSAFEWAALMADAGAHAVHVIHRHDTPSFEPSDWTWVEDMLGNSENTAAWWRSLDAAERERIGAAFWQEGRLKLEPWLAPRLHPERVHLWPNCEITSAREVDDSLRLGLSSPANEIDVDHVVLATGFKPDLDRVGFLSPSLRSAIHTDNGFPELDSGFQTSVPGLYATSMLATRDFGPFLAFTVSVRAGSRILGDAVAASLA